MLHPGAWTQGPAAKLRLPNSDCIMVSTRFALTFYRLNTGLRWYTAGVMDVC